MKTTSRAANLSLRLSLLFLCCSLAPLRAERFGLFTYEVVDEATVEITAYPMDAVGPVEIPAVIGGLPVTSIGYRAFHYCTELTRVTIPSSVSHISEDAFTGCRGLTSITIPASVTTIGQPAFYGCGSLASFIVELGNPQYASAGGVLYNLSQTTLIRCPEGKAGVFVTPTSVTDIGFSAFNNCAALTDITIPSSVTGISGWAFFYCTGLASITIPPGVTSIGDWAFFGCDGLTSITVPASVVSIGLAAFSGGRVLTSIMVEPGNLHYASAGGILFNKAQTSLLGYPGGRVGAFIIPSSVTSIGERAFYSCLGLTRVTIPAGIASIGTAAFAYCSALNDVAIPPSITGIEDYVFFGCFGLTRITIPATVTRIGYGAFHYCGSLASATFLGNAPPHAGAFAYNDPAFTIYYLSSRTGFSSPTWNGYPATMINDVTFPAGAWLLEYGYAYDTSLLQDVDGDGVNLLMAYALGLDPRQNLKGRLPVPILGADFLSLSFYAASSGINYRVETSTDLQNWTAGGVTQTAADQDHLSTAAVARDGPARFLRLKVEQQGAR